MSWPSTPIPHTFHDRHCCVVQLEELEALHGIARRHSAGLDRNCMPPSSTATVRLPQLSIKAVVRYSTLRTTAPVNYLLASCLSVAVLQWRHFVCHHNHLMEYCVVIRRVPTTSRSSQETSSYLVVLLDNEAYYNQSFQRVEAQMRERHRQQNKVSLRLRTHMVPDMKFQQVITGQVCGRSRPHGATVG
jgi:hypothetical protein